MTKLTTVQLAETNKLIQDAINNFILNHHNPALEQIKTLETEVSALKQELNQKSKESQVCDNIWTNIVTGNTRKNEEQNNLLFATTKEKSDQEKRESNIIVFGIPVSKENDDVETKEKINSIINKGKTNNISINKIIRLKKKGNTNNKPAPVLLCLNNKKERNIILREMRHLAINKDPIVSNIFFNEDMTEPQRLIHKRLLAERKQKNLTNTSKDFYFSIRDYKLVKIFKNRNTDNIMADK